MPATIDFKAVFDASPDAYMLLDRDLRFVAANRAYLRTASATLDDLLGREVFDAFPHDPEDPSNPSARRYPSSRSRASSICLIASSPPASRSSAAPCW